MHIFIAVSLQSSLVGQKLPIGTSYAMVLAFYTVVGTSSYGADSVMQVVHNVAAALTFILSFVTKSLMLWYQPEVWGSQLAYLLNACCFLTILTLSGIFVFVWITTGTVRPCDHQYMAHGLLSLAQQTYVGLYTSLVIVMFRNSAKLAKHEWVDRCIPQGQVCFDDVSDINLVEVPVP